MSQNSYGSFIIARQEEELMFVQYMGEAFTNTIEILIFKGEDITDFTFEVAQENLIEERLVKFIVKATRKEKIVNGSR